MSLQVNRRHKCFDSWRNRYLVHNEGSLRIHFHLQVLGRRHFLSLKHPVTAARSTMFRSPRWWWFCVSQKLHSRAMAVRLEYFWITIGCCAARSHRKWNAASGALSLSLSLSLSHTHTHTPFLVDRWGSSRLKRDWRRRVRMLKKRIRIKRKATHV
jgi:hypothetical protein